MSWKNSKLKRRSVQRRHRMERTTPQTKEAVEVNPRKKKVVPESQRS